jgi:putative holliday junction resolvase
MRWLGIDPGAARVGIAACDEEERVAVPLEVVPEAAAFPAIRGIAHREAVGGIVIGLALSLDGSEGQQASHARRLGDRLARELALPVKYEDERLSSAAAERARGRGSRAPRDDVAAALILQQFIDRRRRETAAARPPDRASP